MNKQTVSMQADIGQYHGIEPLITEATVLRPSREIQESPPQENVEPQDPIPRSLSTSVVAVIPKPNATTVPNIANSTTPQIQVSNVTLSTGTIPQPALSTSNSKVGCCTCQQGQPGAVIYLLGGVRTLLVVNVLSDELGPF